MTSILLIIGGAVFGAWLLRKATSNKQEQIMEAEDHDFPVDEVD